MGRVSHLLLIVANRPERDPVVRCALPNLVLIREKPMMQKAVEIPPVISSSAAVAGEPK